MKKRISIDIKKIYPLISLLILPISIISTYFVIIKPEEFIFIYNDYYFQVFTSIAISILFVLRLFIRSNIKVKINLTDILVTLLLVYVSIRISLDRYDSFSELSYLSFLLIVICYFFAKSVQSIAENINILNPALLIAGFIQACIGIMQYSGILNNIYIEFNIGGSLGNPGPFGILIACFIVINIYEILFADKFKKFYKFFLFINGLLLLLVLVLSNSRTAWIATLAGSGYLFYIKFNIAKIITKYFKSWKNKFIILSVGIIVFSLCTIALFNYKKDSATGRILIWENTLNLIKDNPVFGVGYEAFNAHINDYQAKYFENNDNSNYFLLADDIKFAFNDYLQLTANLGLTGLCIFVTIILLALFKNQNHEESNFQKIKLTICYKSIIIVVAIAAFFSYPFETLPVWIILFFAIGVISGNHQPLLTYNLFRKQYLPVISVLIICAISFNVYSIKQLKNSKLWYQANFKYNNGEIENALQEYEKLSYFFQGYEPFYYNYAVNLMNANMYSEAIFLFEKAKYKINSYDINIRLGVCYEKMKDFEAAESYFLKASQIVPSKLHPKYLLILIYQKNKSANFLKQKCEEFLNTKSKFYTPVEGTFKRNVSGILEKL